MFYDLIHIYCVTSSKEASLKAVKLSQSKMRYRVVQNYTKYKKSTIYKWLHVAFGIKIHTMMLLDPFMASLKSKTSSIDPYIKGEV